MYILPAPGSLTECGVYDTIHPMIIICEECQEPTPAKDITTEPYVETTVPHLGIVREWYICNPCAEEKRLWAVDSDSGRDYNGQHEREKES